MAERTSAEARFWSKVDKTDTCWLWDGEITDGYGRLRIGKRRLMAHRIAYEWLVGPIPEGLQLDHLCRVRNCVRPDHLEPVTREENLRRGIHRNTAKTHCLRGHEFTPENTFITVDNERRCRTCRHPNWNAPQTSQYRGVTWDKKQDGWRAQIQVMGKNYYLGLFCDDVDAARAYDDAARLYHGKAARLNDVPPTVRAIEGDEDATP